MAPLSIVKTADGLWQVQLFGVPVGRAAERTLAETQHRAFEESLTRWADARLQPEAPKPAPRAKAAPKSKATPVVIPPEMIAPPDVERRWEWRSRGHAESEPGYPVAAVTSDGMIHFVVLWGRKTPASVGRAQTLCRVRKAWVEVDPRKVTEACGRCLESRDWTEFVYEYK